MATIVSMKSVAIPEEVSLFKNIQSTFPDTYLSGTELLQLVAGKIQLMRLETEIFPSLALEENKQDIKSREKEYVDISSSVAKYKETLESLNGQIDRAIKLCSDVPGKDVRSFAESEQTSTRVYDFCQKILPSLKDWHTKGTLLHKRFDLLFNYDKKNYTESIGNFSKVINPPTWSFEGLVSSLSSFVYASEPAPVKEAPSQVDSQIVPSSTADLEKKNP